MAIDDRLLKLENAFATLAELAAESQSRVSQANEQTSNLEKSFTTVAELASKVRARKNYRPGSTVKPGDS